MQLGKVNMNVHIETIAVQKSVCGEGPIWDAPHNMLYWVDIPEGNIYSYAFDNRRLDVMSTGQRIGSIALAASGCIIAALKNGIYRVDFFHKSMTKIMDPEPGKPDNRLNDGKCDPEGRFWVGSMSDKGLTHAGTLYTLERNACITKKITGLSISNGMDWDADKGKYYHIDTPTKKVMAYDYSSGSGAIQNGQPVLELSDTEGSPDGMTIDAEGMLWIAHWNGSRVSRWDPQTSKKLLEIFLPVSKVTSCIFGGENLDELYVTTAKIGLTEEELSRQPLAGSTFRLKWDGMQGRPAGIVDDSRFEGK